MATKEIALKNLAKATNKGGRPKGVKNKTTLLREAVENGLQDYIHQSAKDVIQVVVKQALEGCRPSQKLLIERVIPNKKSEKDSNSKGVPQIVINVSGRKEDIDFVQDAEIINDD